ncbi:hypothetical protein [Bacillus glycinifermentans]|uniref:Uncharacterized protein n=1 Tax=Bacillus glycinifermentans TaxID=1664069 RepID=A0ABU6H019_9BACI|nr:hypothetical protein [Bacillus glycinifermentans]MEC0484361.1 hypothetical protein [Bacillus glycinifermentans]
MPVDKGTAAVPVQKTPAALVQMLNPAPGRSFYAAMKRLIADRYWKISIKRTRRKACTGFCGLSLKKWQTRKIILISFYFW